MAINFIKPSLCDNTTQPDIYTSVGKSWATDVSNTDSAMVAGKHRYPEPFRRSFMAIEEWIDQVTYTAGSTNADKSKIDASLLLGTLARAQLPHQGLIPAGSVQWAAHQPTVTDAPTGWLWCDGSAYAVPDEATDTYWYLYQAIGTHYGSGTGTFLVPNLAGKFIVAQEPLVTPGDFDVIGETGGAKDVTLTTANIPVDNTHGVVDWSQFYTGGSTAPVVDTDGSVTGYRHGYHAATAATSHENLPPYIVMRAMIKY